MCRVWWSPALLTDKCHIQAQGRLSFKGLGVSGRSLKSDQLATCQRSLDTPESAWGQASNPSSSSSPLPCPCTPTLHPPTGIQISPSSARGGPDACLHLTSTGTTFFQQAGSAQSWQSMHRHSAPQMGPLCMALWTWAPARGLHNLGSTDPAP